MQEFFVDFKGGQKPSIMIVDDQIVGRKVLQEIVSSLDPEYRIKTFSDPLKALEASRIDIPDLVLVDYKMPEMNGVEFTRRFRAISDCADIPVVIVTVLKDRQVRYESLEAGATDFLMRPLDTYEVRSRCKNLLALRSLSRLVKDRSRSLEREVAEATRTIREREKETIFRLAKAGAYHDRETSIHLIRMSKYSREIAEAMGLSEDDCDAIELASPMHDIGKMGIPDEILRKKGKFTPEEYEVMKNHSYMGFEILNGSTSHFINLGAVIALSHQERYDGSGYPSGLRGEEIPLPARIVAVADVFDALTSVRPYKPAWPLERAVEYIREQSGHLFDPRCVDAFLSRLSRILGYAVQFKDLDGDDGDETCG